jgi:hypothetical protein
VEFGQCVVLTFDEEDAEEHAKALDAVNPRLEKLIVQIQRREIIKPTTSDFFLK